LFAKLKEPEGKKSQSQYASALIKTTACISRKVKVYKKKKTNNHRQISHPCTRKPQKTRVERVEINGCQKGRLRISGGEKKGDNKNLSPPSPNWLKIWEKPNKGNT